MSPKEHGEVRSTSGTLKGTYHSFGFSQSLICFRLSLLVT